MTSKNDDIFGRMLPLAGIVDYQPHSIVSRAIVDKGVGTVTIFAFDTGESLSDHTAPYDAIIHILEGEAEVMLEGVIHHPKAGDAVLMKAGQLHNVKAPGRFKMLLIMIRE